MSIGSSCGDSTPQLACSPTSNAASRVLSWIAGVALCILWADLVRQLSYTWSTDEQYAYGWFVPILASGLLVRNWLSRPAPQTPFPASLFIVVAFGLAAVALPPLRVIHEINQDWPLATWTLSLSVVAITMAAIYFLGGWPWVRHFVFPVAFILVAIKWPYRIEKFLMTGLQGLVTATTVEVLGVLGLPALQRGNLIEVSTGVVGVDEACSGIRSFQSTLMAALFLGAHYHLPALRRVALIPLSLAVAILCNIARALFLTWQADANGASAVDRWHDPAGLSVTVLCFAAVWFIAVALAPLAPPDKRPESAVSRAALRVPWGVALASLFSALAALAGPEIWYRTDQRGPADVIRWSLRLPESEPSFESLKLPARTAEILAHDEESLGRWNEPDGSQWSAYCFRWNPTSLQSVIKARQHRPEICLPAAGLRQTSVSSLDHFSAGDFHLPFHKHTFEAENQRLFVFFSLWQDGDEQEGMRKFDQRERIKWVLARRRALGQQTLEIICAGYPDMATAEHAVRLRLPDLIHVERYKLPPANSPK
jgi:exosortase